ncbi:MAG TPA: two-component regulator propeller domain-containing protein [Blastocatellia bacterium]|nr:two-component regulator propeller domain-containing protein [Blastocatellia bacterium]
MRTRSTWPRFADQILFHVLCGQMLCWLPLAWWPGSARAAHAETAPRDNSAYSRRLWRSVDGLPEDFAQSLAQTPDGYLWIGTSGGLVRFDGTSFVVFNRQNTPAFRDDSIYALTVSRDGTLWAGTEGGGMIRYQNGKFRVFGLAEGLTNGFVRVIFEDRDRRLWIGTDAGLFRLQNESVVRVDDRDGVPRIYVHAICEDREGRLLIGGQGLLIRRGAEITYYNSTESQADNSIRTICQTADGVVWLGTISGLRRIDQWLHGNPFEAPRLLSNINISVLRESRRGQLWIGAYGQGLMRYQAGRIVRFSTPDSLPHNNVLSLFEDGEGDIWVGTQGGLLRMSPSAASTITTADGVPQSINTIYQDPRGDLFVAALNGRLFQVSRQTLIPTRLPAGVDRLPVRNVFRDRSGALWIGTDGHGIARLSETETTRYTTQQGLGGDFIRAFCEDRDGQIWIGTDGGLSRWSSGAFQNFKTEDGLAYGSIRALLLDRGGALWIATEGGLSRYQAGAFVTDPLLERFRGRKVWALHEDSDGQIWIGTQGDGLFLWHDQTLTQFTTKAGLPNNKIHFIAEDARENLWMSGPSGIAVVSRRELEALARTGPAPPGSGQLAVRIYSTAEGLSTNQMNGGVQPAGALLASGEAWFPSTKGAVRIEPDGPDRKGSPPVLIEQVMADDHAVQLSESLRLSPGRGKLEIHYTAISLRSPDRIRFKYRMEGFDHDWTDAGQRRVAYYTNLPPGNYRFQVMAYEMDAPRHATEQGLNIEWRPHFYETAWFLALLALVAFVVVWGCYRLHVRNIRQRFAAVLEERNRLAREMHDTLIQGCVGISALLEAASSAREVSPTLSHDLIDRARSEVRAAVDEARLAVWNLRQASGAGLVAAISQLARRKEVETGIPVEFESSGAPLTLTPESEWGVIMIIREALQNAIRHAAPQHLTVRLSFDRRGLQVEIEDDGCGFDTSAVQPASARHYGLIGMRERTEKLGGKFQLKSAPGQGTRVHLKIPLTRALETEIAAPT